MAGVGDGEQLQDVKQSRKSVQTPRRQRSKSAKVLGPVKVKIKYLKANILSWGRSENSIGS
ncbi:hypothetical protein MESS2_300074 [Mesorhizobium metallidurans STM 2683]|uniref:Uncharacterized protein n=1 Tax=Mesorhizobium metallidurans STM 2683 TaxID=1297569 RepID=M5F3F4_9HYPH|nr:hypothetical protein MESS2_300074 [Mesorhizobium metallidurans STM 2683]